MAEVGRCPPDVPQLACLIDAPLVRRQVWLRAGGQQPQQGQQRGQQQQQQRQRQQQCAADADAEADADAGAGVEAGTRRAEGGAGEGARAAAAGPAGKAVAADEVIPPPSIRGVRSIDSAAGQAADADAELQMLQAIMGQWLHGGTQMQPQRQQDPHGQAASLAPRRDTTPTASGSSASCQKDEDDDDGGFTIIMPGKRADIPGVSRRLSSPLCPPDDGAPDAAAVPSLLRSLLLYDAAPRKDEHS